MDIAKEKIRIEIELEDKIKVLVDDKRAKKIREQNNMDELDKDPNQPVDIVFPDNILAVGTSFTNPLFDKSVRNMGSVRAVLDKYNIVAKGDLPREIRERIATLDFGR